MSDALLAALQRQGGLIVDWLLRREDSELAHASVLPDWDVHMLVAHLVLVFEGAGRGLATPSAERPLPIVEYVSRYAPSAGQISATTAGIADGVSTRAL